jgi:hypothetical protein
MVYFLGNLVAGKSLFGLDQANLLNLNQINLNNMCFESLDRYLQEQEEEHKKLQDH